jgi:hypothetical protein
MSHVDLGVLEFCVQEDFYKKNQTLKGMFVTMLKTRQLSKTYNNAGCNRGNYRATAKFILHISHENMNIPYHIIYFSTFDFQRTVRREIFL